MKSYIVCKLEVGNYDNLVTIPISVSTSKVKAAWSSAELESKLTKLEVKREFSYEVVEVENLDAGDSNRVADGIIELTQNLFNTRKAFNDAINFAISLDLEAASFLTLWNEGAWDAIQIEFPEFKLPEGV